MTAKDEKAVTSGIETVGTKSEPQNLENEQVNDQSTNHPDLQSIHNDSDGEEDLKKPDICLDTGEDIVRHVLDVDDNPDEQPWTVRSVFVGVGIGIFGSVISEIYYFKPQTMAFAHQFILIISFVIGEFLSAVIPRRGYLKYLNPFPFNSKEHILSYILAVTASKAALGTEVLAVQKLFYNQDITPAVGMFVIFSSQLLGYSFVGLLRRILIYPTKMYYPLELPLANTLQTLHKDRANNRKRLKVFYLSMLILFLYEIIPMYMFKWLIGISIPCLAAPNSATVTQLFGGSSANEGLGILSVCLDWTYIGGPMIQPLVTTVNQMFGYFLSIATIVGVYYGNIWNSQRLPLMSQSLFYSNSTKDKYFVYDQTRILDSNSNLNATALELEGLPQITGSYVISLISTNMALSSTVVFMALYHWDAIRLAFEWMKPAQLKQMASSFRWKFWRQDSQHDSRLDADGNVPELFNDPHFIAMLRYKPIPQWWFLATLLVSSAVAIVCLYTGHTGLSWWEFMISILISFLLVMFLGGMNAIFGTSGNMQTAVQMIGSYLNPGKPLANMYFTLYGYNSASQALGLLSDMKLAHYVKLSQRSTFCAQCVGTVIGGIFNYIMMNEIITNQREILLSPQGTAIWSGQAVQAFNAQAITWGALAKYMYSIGKEYQWVPLAFLIGFAAPVPFYFMYKRYPQSKFWGNITVPVLIANIGWITSGITSNILSYLLVGFFFQWYLRKKRPHTFANYNYIMSSGTWGGTQTLTFILTFAVFGGGGKEHPFPIWWGNRMTDPQGNQANIDHCKFLGQ